MMTLNHYISDKIPKYGAFKGTGSASPTQRVHVVADTLEFDWVRSRIVVDGYDGSVDIMDTAISLGLKAIPVITAFSTGSAKPWPDDLVELAATLEDIYDDYGQYMPVVVVDNEEFNPEFHSGTDAEYYDFVNTVYNTYHKYGIRVANGGFGDPVAINMNVYRYVLDTYGSTLANAYGLCMTSGQKNAVTNPASNPGFAARQQRLLDFMAACGSHLDYINFHGYEPFDITLAHPESATSITPHIWRFRKEYCEMVWKKPLMSNELGQGWENDTPEITGSLLAELHRLGFDHAQWYDGTNNAGVFVRPLTSEVYPATLLDTGTVAHDWVQAHK